MVDDRRRPASREQPTLFDGSRFPSTENPPELPPPGPLTARPATSPRRPVPGPGDRCRNDRGSEHVILPFDGDQDLLTVSGYMGSLVDLPQLIGDAIEDAIYYVLDGWRTHRFDLNDESVDSDERRTVGTKLQYHVIDNLGLKKSRHPDTHIDGVGVELKGTIGSNWTIPKEGQCGVTLLIRVDTVRWRHRTQLMRTHRVWLYSGAGNNDGKRGIVKRALDEFARDLYQWRPLRPNPLTQLRPDDRDFVFGVRGQQPRLIRLFTALPGVVVQRSVILTVCANRADPLRRVRAIRKDVRAAGFALLCGQWKAQRELGALLGFDLAGAAWVAVPWQEMLVHRALSDLALVEMGADLAD